VIVTFASLSVDQQSDRYVEDEARRLHHLLRLASEEAVLTSQELSLMVSKTGYAFAALNGPKWEPIADDAMFRSREFEPGLHVELSIYDREVDFEASDKPSQIYLLSSGELTPFKMSFVNDNEEAYTIQGSLTGQLTFLRPGDSDEDV
jgi:general secretion pathway protein H